MEDKVLQRWHSIAGKLTKCSQESTLRCEVEL